MVIADRGYLKNTEFPTCDNANIKDLFVKSMTSGAIVVGRFGSDEFIHDATNDVYRCPADQMLTRSVTMIDRGNMMYA